MKAVSAKNQIDAVTKHLKRYGNLTATGAWELYGVQRLAAIIFVLRKRGMNIETIDCAGHNRYGEAMTYAKYVYHRYD